MPSNSIAELYQRFSEQQIMVGRVPPENNEFHKVSEAEVRRLEEELEFSLPEQIRDFYLNVGWGFLNVDASGRYQNEYPNNIIDLDRMKLFWRREEISFDYDRELVENDELVFFDMGNYMYLVLRPFSEKPNAVYYPRDQKPVAEDFNDFILRLYENTTFYLDHEGVYID